MTQVEMADALAGFPVYEPPGSLYRFYSASGLNALTAGTLRITPPREFNDPFEMSPGFVTDDLTEDSIRRSFISPSSLSRAAYSRRHANEAAYRKWVDELPLRNPALWPQYLGSMRESVIQATSEVHGVSCFSAFSEDVLCGPMGIRHWAMYADNHKGFSIEYDGRHALLRNLADSKWLFPVSYRAERPTIGIAEFDDWTERKTLQVLRRWLETKCLQAWGDEMEWRLICPLSPDPQGRVEISITNQLGQALHLLHIWGSNQPVGNRPNSTVIKRVILGVRADKDLESRIVEALKEPHLRHVGLCRARLCERHFALRIERV